MSTMTLTEFLTARFTEDEAAFAVQPEDADSAYDACESYVVELHKRLRAECEAKRAIVDLHSSTDQTRWYGDDDPPEDGLGIGCTTCGTADEYAVRWPCTTLCALAAPYADHPDYLPEWKP